MEILKRVRKLVDFDGVIIDTRPVLFKDYYKDKESGLILSRTEYVIKRDWDSILQESEIIGNAIDVLKELKELAILSRIHSLENEAVSKVRFLRELGVECDFIPVPYPLEKTDIVNPEGCILLDDDVYNLDKWILHHGIPFFFDLRGNNIDDWGRENKKYKRIKKIDELKDY